jgi:hypothetical protein
MEKVTATYQRLQSIIVHTGCPICALSQQAVTTFLSTLLWESSNDLNVSEMLTESLGFCGRHSREMLSFGGQRLAVAVVERLSLLAAIRRLPEVATCTGTAAPSWFQLWQPRQAVKEQPRARLEFSCDIKPCPACVRAASEAARGIEELVAHLDELSSLLLAAGGLCLPHFVQAMYAADAVQRERLLTIEQRAWTDLAADLEEFIRKHMDHHHAEPVSERARLAVERAIAGLTGENGVAR